MTQREELLIAKLAELVKENESLRAQLKAVCNAFMEKPL